MNQVTLLEKVSVYVQHGVIQEYCPLPWWTEEKNAFDVENENENNREDRSNHREA